METGIHVGPKIDAESVAFISGAIVDILTVCADKRIPEAVMLKALDTLRRTSDVSGVNLSNVNLTDARGDVVRK